MLWYVIQTTFIDLTENYIGRILVISEKQSQKAVSAYFTCKQILSLALSILFNVWFLTLHSLDVPAVGRRTSPAFVLWYFSHNHLPQPAPPCVQ